MEPKSLYPIPNDLSAFIKSRYDMTLEEFNIYVKFNNIDSSSTLETKNGVTRQVIPDPALVKASDTLQQYELRAHQNTTAGPPTPELRASATKAFTQMIEFCDKSLKHIYFETDFQPMSYRSVKICPAEKDSKFSQLSLGEQAIVNLAVAVKYDAEHDQQAQDQLDGKIPHKLKPVDDPHVNARRQEIVANEGLFNSLKQRQKDLRDKYKGVADLKKTPSEIPTPQAEVSESLSPGH